MPATDVVLDVDTGVDDALALLLAVRAPGPALRAVTCVAGNVHVDRVVANTCRVLDAAGAPPGLPVARGAAHPLGRPVQPERRVHGADGLADLGLPPSRRPVDGEGAVGLLRRVLTEARRPVVLACLGPLTNVARLVRAHPEVLPRVGRVVVVGGTGADDDTTAVPGSGEFNLAYDPEAAAVVLGASLPLTRYGLDVFRTVTVPVETAAALAVDPEPGRRLAGRLLRHQASRSADGRTACLGDAGAVAAVCAPDLLETVPRGDPPVDVAVAVEADRGAGLFLRALGGGPGAGTSVRDAPPGPPPAPSAPPPPG